MKIKIFDSTSYSSDYNVSMNLELNINRWLDDQNIKIFKIESDIIEHKIITRIWYEE